MAISPEDLTTPGTADPDPTILDHAEIVKRFTGDTQLVLELYALFSQEWQNYYAAINNALAQGDPRVLNRTAHNLKGSVANFGPTPAIELAQQLETLGHDGTTAGASPIVEELGNALRELVAKMQSHLAASEQVPQS